MNDYFIFLIQKHLDELNEIKIKADIYIKFNILYYDITINDIEFLKNVIRHKKQINLYIKEYKNNNQNLTNLIIFSNTIWKYIQTTYDIIKYSSTDYKLRNQMLKLLKTIKKLNINNNYYQFTYSKNDIKTKFILNDNLLQYLINSIEYTN